MTLVHDQTIDDMTTVIDDNIIGAMTLLTVPPRDHQLMFDFKHCGAAILFNNWWADY